VIHEDSDSGYCGGGQSGDAMDNGGSWIASYGWNRFRCRLSVRDHSDALDISRIVTIKRIVDGHDLGRVSRAGIAERDGHDETSQQDQGKDSGPSMPARTGPSTIDLHLAIAAQSHQFEHARADSLHCQVDSSLCYDICPTHHVRTAS